MNFSTHIHMIAKSMVGALEESKAALIKTLDENLHSAREILKVDSFDYWINQIASTSISEIPTTNYGVNEAKRIWHPISNTRSSLESALISSCETLLSYSAEDDMCIAQGDYHYYVHMPTGAIFKESTLGLSPDRPTDDITRTDIRIAHISELNPSSCELYE